jgi:hypothetical protein
MVRLQDLLEKRKKLDAQIQAVRSKEVAKKRKEDTRRKILVGAAILEEVAAGGFPEEKLRKILDSQIVRPGDRALFQLSAKPEQPKQ